MSKGIRIAYFLNRFPHLTETFILREMVLLRRLGLDVHVFSMSPPLSTLMHEQVQEMMPYAHYSPYLLSTKLLVAQVAFLFSSPGRYFRAFFRAIWLTYREPHVLLRLLAIFPKSVLFAREVEELGISHIHAHFVWVNGVSAGIVHDLTGVTFTLHPHAFGLFMRDQVNVRKQLESATGLVTVSEYHRRYIATLCPRWSTEEIEVVHYGLDPAEFRPAPVPAENDVARIISVGSLVEKKGHEYLIEACAQLAQDGYAFQCCIVGGGPLQEQLAKRIDGYQLQDCVHLVGAKTQEEVKGLYRHSDLFVLACVVAKSGDRDGMPNVLLEAMSMEIPVVTTPVTGIPELVREGETGLLVPERDAQALKAAIKRLIDDKRLRERIGRQGRQIVLNQFDIHQTAAQLASIFQNLGKE